MCLTEMNAGAVLVTPPGVAFSVRSAEMQPQSIPFPTPTQTTPSVLVVRHAL